MIADADLEAYLEVEERSQRALDPRTARRIFRQLWRHRGWMLSGMLLMLLSTFAVLAEPRILGWAIDEAIIPRDMVRLRQLTLAFLLVQLARAFALIANAYCFEVMGQRTMLDLRSALFDQLQRLPISTHDRNPAGKLVTRLTNDVAALADMFSSGWVAFAGNVLVVTGILAWLFFLDARLALISAGVLPFLAAASVYFSKRLRVAYRNARSKLSALNAFLAENIMGMRIVQLFNRQELHFERFRRINRWYSDAQISSVRVFAYFHPAITLASGIAIALLIWRGGVDVQDGRIKIGVLVAFLSYVLSLFQPMRELADKWNVFLSGMASAERIFSILDWEIEAGSDPRLPLGPVEPLVGIKGKIVFEDVWFAYENLSSGEPRWVLRGFNLEISPGERIGIVGHTGAGKTTLISLLMRFYEPQKGRIFLDGRELRDYDLRRLRASIGIVQQDVFLFSGSVVENLNLFKKPTSRHESDLISAMDRIGYGQRLRERQTSLGERGNNLSAGERQVLAFGRALASDPAIWILDEATSNIDSQTEARIGHELDRAACGRTRLLIAHRLATVQTADRILVLNKGGLAEQGTHAELLERDGLYARLYRYQQLMEPAGNS